MKDCSHTWPHRGGELQILHRPEMVGREKEFGMLAKHLDDAIEGRGSLVLISGEAGIGKTRLVEELKARALSRGVKVLSGFCLDESLTPYMPFLEALRSAGLEELFAEEVPRVEALYLVSNTGLLIREAVREETRLDPDIFASMLGTVGDFVSESLSMLTGRRGVDRLSRVDFGRYSILIERGPSASLIAILVGRENEFLISDLKKIVQDVHRVYGKALERWDGYAAGVAGIEGFLHPLLTSGKYDGIHYARDYPNARRNLLVENVALGLARQALGLPIVLFMEDLQWADPSTVALLHYVARNTKRSHLLIVGTFRPEDLAQSEGRPHHLTETMQLMSQEELVARIDLQRLPEKSVLAVLVSILGSADFSHEFVRRVYRHTEGNPLFIVELVRLMADKGMIRFEGGAWRLAMDLEEVGVPPVIRELISMRLDGVEADNRGILEVASVVGEEFACDLLSSALNVERLQLLKALAGLEKRHRLVRPQNAHYRFDHVVVKEVLYSEIPTKLRREYHGIIAECLERLNKDRLDQVVGSLAYHYYQAENRGKALPYLLQVANGAADQYSNAEAIQAFSRALECVDEPESRAGILEKLGTLYELIGDYEKAIQSGERASTLTVDPERKAKMLTQIGWIHLNRGDLEAAMTLYSTAMELVQGQGTEVEADLVGQIGHVYNSRGEFGRALERFEKSRKIREMLGDERGTSIALHNIADVEWNQGEFDRALEHFAKSLETFEALGYLKGIAASLNNMGCIEQVRGAYEKALGYLQRSREIRERMGDQPGVACSLINIGDVLVSKKQLDRALEAYRESLAMMEKIGDRGGIATCLHNIGDLESRRGNFDKALTAHRTSLAIYEERGRRKDFADSYCGLAEVYLRMGSLDEALEFGWKALDLATELGQKENVAMSRRILGTVYRNRGAWTDSIENFDESIRMYREIGLEPGAAESHYAFGLMWKEKGHTSEAMEHLLTAMELYRKLNLDGDLDKAREAYESIRATTSGEATQAG